MRLQKNQKGIAHHLLLVVTAVFVLGAVGFAGFKVYKSKNDVNAKAAGWTSMGIGGGSEGIISISGCKQSVNSAYGPLWKVQLRLSNGTNSSLTGNFQIVKAKEVNGKLGGLTLTNNYLTAKPKSWAYKEVYASQLGVKIGNTWYADRFGIAGGIFMPSGFSTNSSNFYSNLEYKFITNC